MAVKKSKPAEASAKAPARKVAAKPKKEAAPKKAKSAPVVATDTAAKAETPKPKVAPKATAAAAPKKAAAPVKLTERQLDFLKQIHGAKEAGYLGEKTAEQRKLIKKGAKDKTSGAFRYVVSKAGEKHLSTVTPA
jgi:hypothetical protein